MQLANSERKNRPFFRRAHQVAARLLEREREIVVRTPQERFNVISAERARRRKIGLPSLDPVVKIQRTAQTDAQRVIDKLLAEQLNPKTELDLRPSVVRNLTSEILWELGRDPRCAKCTVLNLAGWAPTVGGMRSISISMGERVKLINMDGCPVSDDLLRVLCARLFAIINLSFSGCSSLENKTMKIIADGCGKTLRALNLTNCYNINDVGITWLAGAIGQDAKACSKLQSLSLEGCVGMRTAGLQALGERCRALVFVNLCGCTEVTDEGIEGLVKGCRNLQVLNLRGCVLISDVSLRAMGRSLSELRSLNLGRCSKISDEGLEALVESKDGAWPANAKLQSINLAGCALVSENGVCKIAARCKSLRLLNVTGCELITDNGLRELLRGLPFVEMAASFTGFKAVEGYTTRRVSAQRTMIEDAAALQIQAVLRGNQTRKRLRRERVLASKVRVANFAARRWRGICGRVVYAQMLHQKHRRASAAIIQKAAKKKLARLKIAWVVAERDRAFGTEYLALKIQSFYRGRTARKANPGVPMALRQLKRERWEECLGATAVRVQSLVRKKLSVRYSAARREEIYQRTRDMKLGIVKIQKLTRRYNAILRVIYLQEMRRKKNAFRSEMATDIQRMFRGLMGRKLAQEVYEAHLRFLALQEKKARDLQRAWRGKIGRIRFQRILALFKLHTKCAVRLQKIFRGHQVDDWKTIRFKLIRQRVLARDEVTAANSRQAVRELVEKRLADLARDSASDTESEGDDDWEELWDKDERRLFYWSASRSQRSWEKPVDRAFEKSLVGSVVKVHWPKDEYWFPGYLAKYNRSKNRHRIEYDDGTFFLFFCLHIIIAPLFLTSNFACFPPPGDHEWLDLRMHEARIMIYMEDTQTWCMMRHVQPTQLQLEGIVEEESGTAEAVADVEEEDPAPAEEEEEEEKETGAIVDAETASLYEEHYDESAGTFFVNVRTGESVWEAPEGARVINTTL